MLKIGEMNKLKVVKHVDFGVFLDGFEHGEILLPLKFMPGDCETGEELDVFICYDSNDRLMATTETPLATLGDFALLKVVSISNIGAFLNWGLAKDLFLPFAERTAPIEVGDEIIVYIYLDKSERISCSMRLERNKVKSNVEFTEGQKVKLLIAGKTELGFKAIIEGGHWGILYQNEVFQNLQYGQKIDGYVKKMRDDGKIDLILQQAGHKAAQDEIGPKIISLLKSKGGFLAINDKTDPDTIYKYFGVSKKKYKIALGGLYKQRLITVGDDGIRLVDGKKI